MRFFEGYIDISKHFGIMKEYKVSIILQVSCSQENLQDNGNLKNHEKAARQGGFRMIFRTAGARQGGAVRCIISLWRKGIQPSGF